MPDLNSQERPAEKAFLAESKPSSMEIYEAFRELLKNDNWSDEELGNLFTSFENRGASHDEVFDEYEVALYACFI